MIIDLDMSSDHLFIIYTALSMDTQTVRFGLLSPSLALNIRFAFVK